eukprot:320174-Chlamydomonas_euryale.AAC.1
MAVVMPEPQRSQPWSRLRPQGHSRGHAYAPKVTAVVTSEPPGHSHGHAYAPNVTAMVTPAPQRSQPWSRLRPQGHSRGHACAP